MDWYQRLAALLYEGGGVLMQQGCDLLPKAGTPLFSRLLLFGEI